MLDTLADGSKLQLFVDLLEFLVVLLSGPVFSDQFQVFLHVLLLDPFLGISTELQREDWTRKHKPRLR